MTPGRRIGVYEIVAPIGAGGMGEVYRAKDTRLGRDVAIKILPHAFTSDPDRLARFEREARVLASLSHPNIATIHGVEEGDGVNALVLELVPGDTLAERIEKAGRHGLTLKETLTIARQIADALDAAHEKGIVHRDLKPANIKITPEGLVKVLDFGLAKLQPAEGTPNASRVTAATFGNTHEGVIVGTAAYMSPEQARGQVVDKRTDIWAFGCVLYEMLTGAAAFARPTVTDTLAAIVEHSPAWEALPEVTPRAVVRLIRRCLDKDPRSRLRDIGDARVDIEDSIEALAAPRGAATATSRAHRTRGGSVWRYMLVGALGAVLAGVGMWLIGARNGALPPPSVRLSVLPEKGTTFPSTGPWPAISPDGRHIVFTAAPVDGEARLWLRQLESTGARPLQGTEGAIRPFWAPDSRSIGFFANGTLSRVDIESGATQVIGEARYFGGLSGAWGDGAIVLAAGRTLNRISPAGGDAQVLIRDSDQSVTFNTPSFLPDGRRFLYLVRRGDESRLCIASLDSDERSCLDGIGTPAVFAPPGYLLYVSGGALVAQPFDQATLEVSGGPIRLRDAPINPTAIYEPPLFSASRTGVLAFHSGAPENQLAWRDRTGARLGPPLGPGDQPALSPDESLLAVRRRDLQRNTTDLWLHDLRNGTDSRFTFDPGDEQSPMFSPDGQTVLYAAGASAPLRIYQKRVQGDTLEEPIVPEVRSGGGHWSSDGRFLLVGQRGVKTGFDLAAVRIGSSDPPLPVAQTEYAERQGRFSPDVRWVAYDSTETGRREVWVQPFPPTGARWQVSRAGGVSPQWRADGKELFYVAADGRLMAVSIEASRALKAGAPTALFQTIFSGGVYADYAVSKDGQRFVVPVPPALEDVAPVTIILNWTATLTE